MCGDRNRLGCVVGLSYRAWVWHALKWVCGRPLYPENGLEGAVIVSGSIDRLVIAARV